MTTTDGQAVDGYQFEEAFYDKNEAILFSLINNTKKDFEKIGIKPARFT